MDPLTPQQRDQMRRWTEQRDSILREIGNYSTELNNLKASTKSEGLHLADLHEQIAEARGRLSELTALEERQKSSVSIEISELEVRKSRLEVECVAAQKDLDSTKREHGEIIAANLALKDAQGVMKDQAAVVASVTGQIIETSKSQVNEAKSIMIEVRAMADAVIAKGNENVKTAQLVIDKMPKFIFEMQKPIPVRRTYPKGHPNAHQGITES